LQSKTANPRFKKYRRFFEKGAAPMTQPPSQFASGFELLFVKKPFNGRRTLLKTERFAYF